MARPSSSLASTDAVTAVLVVVLIKVGMAVSGAVVTPTARAAEAAINTISFAIFVAARTKPYDHYRDAVAVVYRLIMPLLTQTLVANVVRNPHILPTPPTPQGWLAFALGRFSPMLAAILAVSARLPQAATFALSFCVVATYAALQPSACAVLPLNSHGIDDYLVSLSAALNAGAHAAASVLTGVPPPQVLPPPPCPPQSCFATITMLHAVAVVGPAIATARGRRWGGVIVWCVVGLVALSAAPLLGGARPEGGCPAEGTPPHPLLLLQAGA